MRYNKIRTFAELANVAQHTLTCHATRADVCARGAIFTRTIGTGFHPCCPIKYYSIKNST